jgi:hypothetical protein
VLYIIRYTLSSFEEPANRTARQFSSAISTSKSQVMAHRLPGFCGIVLPEAFENLDVAPQAVYTPPVFHKAAGYSHCFVKQPIRRQVLRLRGADESFATATHKDPSTPSIWA